MGINGSKQSGDEFELGLGGACGTGGTWKCCKAFSPVVVWDGTVLTELVGSNVRQCSMQMK